MLEKLQVQKSDKNGLPFAIVPSGCMWHLVEYLSYQRIAVSYEISDSEIDCLLFAYRTGICPKIAR